MTDADRFRLLFGPYRTPRFHYGRVVFCEVRGEVTVCGLSDGPIPWPLGKRGRAKSLVVYGDLAEAVRRESNLAVAHWWGISPQTVSLWRKALGVGPVTAGTARVLRDHLAETYQNGAREIAVARSRDPEVRARMAASRKGKPPPRDRSGRRRPPRQAPRLGDAPQDEPVPVTALARGAAGRQAVAGRGG